MSIAAINWVAKQRVGNSNAKALLFWLAFHHNAETGLCCPGIKTLQAEMEVGSVNTVRTAMRLLKKLGFITAQPELKNGAIYRTLYTLNLDRISAEAPAIGDRSSQVEPPSVNEGGAIDVGGSAGDPGEGQQMTRGGSNGGRGEGQQVTPNREIEQGINRERNRESSMRTSGKSSAIASAASAQAQTLPTSFPQSSNSQNHSEAGIAGKDSLSNASERSVAAHRDRLDASDEQTLQNDAECSQNASTRISGACPENEPPPMSDEDLENLFANAQLEECPPFPEKGAHLSEKGDHPSPAPKRKRVSNVQKPESVSEQVWEDFSALRTKRRAPITETALRGIQREAEKAGISLEAALSTCCERGWQGFKAEWYENDRSQDKAGSSQEDPGFGWL